MDFEDPSKKKGLVSASLLNDGLGTRSSGADNRIDFNPRSRKPRYQSNSSIEIRSSLTAGRTFTREQLAQLQACNKRGANSSLKWFFGLTAGIAGMVSVLAFANSKFFDNLAKGLRNSDTSAMASTADQFSVGTGGSGYLFNFSLFGPQAVASCKRRCMISGTDTCDRDCDYLELSRFPYERLRENINPRRDVAKSNYLCQEGAKTMGASSDIAVWQREFDPAMALLAKSGGPDKSVSVAQLRLQMTQLERVMTELKLPPTNPPPGVNADPTSTIDLYRALCLLYSTNLARLGAGVGSQMGDRNVEHYYSDFAAGSTELLNELRTKLVPLQP